MTVFIQTPVIATLGNSHITFSRGVTGDLIRIVLCIFFTLLSLYFLALLAKRLGVSWNGLKYRLDNRSKVVLHRYMLATLLMTFTYLVLLYIGNGYNVGTVPSQISQMSERPAVFFLFLMTGVVTQPILEEILFRGILQKKLGGRIWWIGIVISSVVFAFGHDYDTFLNSHLISSLIYGTAYYLTNNIKVPIIIHSVQNLLVLMFVIILK